MDNLVVRNERPEFVSELIQRRGFVRAKYWSWDAPRNGLVTFASPEFLRVLFQTGVNVATSYYTIKIAEVASGLWEIIYTPDLEHFYKISGGESPEGDDIDLVAEVHRLFEEA